MENFSYVALEPSGKRRTGFLEASDKDAAISHLSNDGSFVLEIKPQRLVDATTGRNKKKATRQDIALFTRRLADLAEAGLPLDRVLQVLGEQSESGQLCEISENALADVRSGIPVSAALAKYPKLFPPLYTETLRSGEASGQFSQVATRLADFQEKDVAQRSQIVSAMIYPSILAFVAVSVVIFLLTFVVPRLSGVFADLGDALPATTKLLLATTAFLTQNGLILLVVIAVAVFLFKAWASTEEGGIAKDTLLLKVPILGKVITKAVISRYARVLGTLLFGGVQILDALRLAGLACGNKLFLVTSDAVAEDVRNGKRINQAMKDTGVFPPVLVHMVAVGEETGDLPKVLGRVSDSLDFEVEVGIRRLTAMVEPLILVTMGAFVGFVVLAIALPIFDAQNLVK